MKCAFIAAALLTSLAFAEDPKTWKPDDEGYIRNWLLLANHTTYAGHGRCYGRADVFGVDGSLVASYVQDGMIRRIDGSPSGARL